MTLTLAAVYAPVAFAPARTGKLFTEFALTLAGAVLVSGFVALTLSPMMCSRCCAPRDARPLLQFPRARAARPEPRLPRALDAVSLRCARCVVVAPGGGRRAIPVHRT
jgi:multidrug efflux pump subunit AcrB